MVVGPLTWIEYDADTLQVFTDSDILLVDRDLRVTATGLDITLRPKSDPNRSKAGTGFEGAEGAVLRKNISMTFSDVGSTGVLPGAVKSKKTADGKVVAEADVDPKLAQNQKPAAAAEPIPLNIQCDGPMQIDLPNAPMPVKVGPPAPAAPTLVRYHRNVVVRRGKLSELPDQLNCDTLDLTLLPTEKPPAKPKTDVLAKSAAPNPATATEPPAQEEKDLFGGLALRRAKASGHAVWLQLPSQEAKILCIELIHSRDPITGKNTTHFLGGSRRLMLVKQDVAQAGPDRGKVQSVTNVWCADATLIDDGDMDRATLVANGPGLLETRPGQPKGDGPPRETPPDRTAVWQDQLWFQNEIGPEGAIVGKIVVLKGMPRVVDRLQKASLDAAESIVVWLDSKPDAPKTAQTLDLREVVPAAFTVADPASATKPAAGGMTIKRLLAVKDVHLVVPSRDVRYREHLNVDFEQSKITGSPPAPAASATPAPVAAPAPPADGQSAAPAPKPAEPLMTAIADRGQIRMIVGPKAPASGQADASSSSPLPGASDASYQIRDVDMRGGVVLHQDPGPGKTKGTDATGEVLILAIDRPGKAIFDLYHHDPYSRKTRRIDPETMPRARVSTEEMTIEAKVIGVNQVTNGAWAYGAGTLTQMTDRGLLTDRSPDAQKQAEDGDGKTLVVDKPKQKRAGKLKSEKTKITISWADKMTFEGVTVDPFNRPAAKAVFYNNARAEMEDAVLYAGESMTTYTDQPIPLAEFGKLTQKPKAASAAANSEDLPAVVEDEKPKPDLALIVCKGEEGAVDENEMAVAITRKVDPDRPIIASLQKIAVKELTYDRRSGEFLAPGPGMVFLYDRENDPTKPKTAPSLNEAAAPRRTIRPTAFQSGGDGEDKVAVRNADAAGAAARRAAAPKSLVPPLILTQVQFNKKMQGRFGTGRQDDVNQQRWAEFFGGVQTARCEVPNASAKLNYDHLPANAYFLTSETLRVITEPPPTGSGKDASSRNFLKAWDNATVYTKNTTLQADVITYDSLNDLVYANAP